MYVCMYIALIKFDEWVDTTDLYNKRVILGLRNLSRLMNVLVGVAKFDMTCEPDITRHYTKLIGYGLRLNGVHVIFRLI